MTSKICFVIFSLASIFLVIATLSCARQVDKSPHIQKVDTYFQSHRFAQALDLIRSRTQESDDKDRLLYLMEAGTILHTMGEWEKSNLAFQEADEISEKIRLSRRKEILAFFINQNKQNFVGENFERVKIKFYLALNHIMLGERGRALAYFRSLNQVLSDIRFEGNDYKQNFAARYLGAILAEEDGNYNFARVQYNNMLSANVHTNLAKQSLYRIGLLENDREALDQYASHRQELIAYTTNGVRISLPHTPDATGSLILIHESGISPYKTSQGMIKDEPFFKSTFKASLKTSLSTDQQARVNAITLLYLVGESQNPIPIYKDREDKNFVIQPEIQVSGISFIPVIMDDYRSTVYQNYNDKYQDYVKYNIVSIVTRVLSVYLTSQVVEKQGNKKNQNLFNFLGWMINVTGGAIIQSVLQPDLRSWSLTYSNLQIKRIFLQPGEYRLKMMTQGFHYLNEIPEKIIIKPNQAQFVLIKSF